MPHRRRMVRRFWRWLPFVLVAACASTRARPAGERADWVLVRTPMSENLGIPIYSWERVRMFASAEDCSIYRMELLENAMSAGSRTHFDEVYRVHYLPPGEEDPPPRRR